PSPSTGRVGSPPPPPPPPPPASLAGASLNAGSLDAPPQPITTASTPARARRIPPCSPLIPGPSNVFRVAFPCRARCAGVAKTHVRARHAHRLGGRHPRRLPGRPRPRAPAALQHRSIATAPRSSRGRGGASRRAPHVGTEVHQREDRERDHAPDPSVPRHRR